MKHELSEFIPELKPRFDEVSKYLISEEAICAFRKHDKELNKKLNTDSRIDLFSMIVIMVSNTTLDNDGYLPIRISLNLVCSLEYGSYNHSFPNPFRQSYIPNRINNESEIKWNPESNCFVYRGKQNSLTHIVDTLYEKHIKSTFKHKGFAIRALRRMRWFVALKPLLSMARLAASIIYICSGKKLTVKLDVHTVKVLLLNDSEYKVVVNEKKQKTVNFFGMEVDTIPLITYSLINLIAYYFCYLIDFKPIAIKNMINNAFLSILYVVLSYSLMFYLVPRISMKILDRINSSINKMTNDMIPIISEK